MGDLFAEATFPGLGTYTCTLVIADADGVTDEDTVTILVMESKYMILSAISYPHLDIH